MQIKIGKKIRELCRHDERTQEAFAVAAHPDMKKFPAIAYYLLSITHDLGMAAGLAVWIR